MYKNQNCGRTDRPSDRHLKIKSSDGAKKAPMDQNIIIVKNSENGQKLSKLSKIVKMIKKCQYIQPVYLLNLSFTPST